MKKACLATALAAGLLLPTVLLAKDKVFVSPVYRQLVAISVPMGFHGDYEAEKDGTYILELVPEGETVDTWTQIITITGGRGLAGRVAPVDAAASIAEGYQNACPDTFTARAFPAPKVKGAVEVFSGYLGCGDAEGGSEQMVFLVLRGAEDLYTVQWAERGAALPGKPDADPAHWRPRSDALALTRLCDRIAGESAPYPSCTE